MTSAGSKPSSLFGRTRQKQSIDTSDSKKNLKILKNTNRSENRQDDKISDTVAGSSRDLSMRERTRKKQIQSVHHSKKKQLHLPKFASSIEPVRRTWS